MEAEEVPNVLSDLMLEVQPAPDSLAHIYRGLGAATLEAEEGRLRERFLDIAGRLATISEVRGSI